MPSRREVLERNQIAMERAENRAAREIADAYNRARRELLGEILDRWGRAGVITPGRAVTLLRSLGIIQAIDLRLAELETEHGAILRGVLNSSDERALALVARELALLPPEMRPDLSAFTRINTELVERFLPQALDDAELGSRALAGALRRELRQGLIQGEAFPALARRLFTTSEPSTFRSGMVSAERGVRRLVITAENNARTAYIQQAREQIPELKRQAIATIGPRTTDTCLRVHGQIVGVDEPFTLTGDPKFASQMMGPAFHWGCRTSVTAWHPVFEGGGLNTANMERSAAAERRRRAG